LEPGLITGAGLVKLAATGRGWLGGWVVQWVGGPFPRWLGGVQVLKCVELANAVSHN